MSPPTYDELAAAFWEYLAQTDNDGAPVAPREEDIETARTLLTRTGVTNPYPGFPPYYARKPTRAHGAARIMPGGRAHR